MISDFFINQHALERVQQILNRSGYDDPVAALADIAIPEANMYSDKKFQDIQKSIFEGKKPDYDNFIKTIQMQFEDIKSKLTYNLEVLPYSKSESNLEQLFVIQGITFDMSIGLRQALDSYILEYEKGKFFFKNEHKVIRNLQSIGW